MHKWNICVLDQGRRKQGWNGQIHQYGTLLRDSGFHILSNWERPSQFAFPGD